MKRTSPRAEPISTHLERHRDCLERRGAEHAIDSAAGGKWSGVPSFDWHRPAGAALPFARPDDED